MTSAFRRLSLCVAGVARMALGWLRWRAWAGVAGVVAADLLTHNLSTLTHTQLVHTQLVHTYSHTTCPHRPCSQLVHLHLAGLVLGDIDLHFVGQAWHVWHWAVSGGALGPEWPGWSPRLLAWQAWYLVTSTFTLCGSRGTCVTQD